MTSSILVLIVLVLGIETSCDETAAAVVEDGKKLLSNVVLSSMDLHAAYGGVVPEIAARSHIESIMPVINQALEQAACTWDDIDAIAVTYGAGLGGSLLVGVMTARTLAITKNKPLYACNHVEGHIYVNFLTETSPALTTKYQLPTTAPAFPILGLIVSGGHSQLVLWRSHFDYTLLGQTGDDAIGEAFDKVAKIIGLPYPGGPSISEAAKSGDPYAYNFPKAKLSTVSSAVLDLRAQISEERRGDEKHSDTTSEIQARLSGYKPAMDLRSKPTGGYDYSFSGIKTAVLRTAQAEIGQDHTFPSSGLSERLNEAQKANIAASFQRVAIETVVDKTVMAYQEFQPATVLIGGGVASSPELRRQLSERLPIQINYTDPKLCTDNGAMIATLGSYQIMNNIQPVDPYSLEIAPNLSM